MIITQLDFISYENQFNFKYSQFFELLFHLSLAHKQTREINIRCSPKSSLLFHLLSNEDNSSSAPRLPAHRSSFSKLRGDFVFIFCIKEDFSTSFVGDASVEDLNFNHGQGWPSKSSKSNQVHSIAVRTYIRHQH